MTPDQAKRAALDALAAIRQGHDPQAEKVDSRTAITVATLIDAFERHVRAHHKPRTVASYKVGLDRLRVAYGRQPAGQLTRQQITALHASLAAMPYAANRMVATISACFAWAIDQGLLPEGSPNPAARVTHYREQGRERFLSPEEIGRLGAALREAENQFGPWAIAAIRLLLLTGARLREILDARWEQLDVGRGCLFLLDSKTGAKPLILVRRCAGRHHRSATHGGQSLLDSGPWRRPSGRSQAAVGGRLQGGRA